MSEQHDRTKYLGSSDAAAVLGLSPWATPVELWQQKTGIKPKDVPDARRQKLYDRGHKLEPFIRDMTLDKLRDMGLTVELLACNERYKDAAFPFMACEIDFELRLTGEVVIGDELVQFDGEHINADAKSVTGFARKKWGEVDTEDVPIEYAAQFLFGLMVTGRRYCLVAALRSFDDVDIYWTVRDDETIAGARTKWAAFWLEHVVPRVPPDPLVFDDIKALFPLDDGTAVEASADVADKVSQLRDVKSRIKEFETAEEALRFEIAEAISPHTSLTFGGRQIASWKGQSRRALDMDRFKTAHPELFDEFSKTSVVRILRLSK